MLTDSLVHLFEIGVGISAGGGALMAGIVRPALRRVSYSGVALEVWGAAVNRFVPIAVGAAVFAALVRIWMIEAAGKETERAMGLIGYLMIDASVVAVLLVALLGSNRRMRRALVLRHDRDARRMAATSTALCAAVGVLGLFQLLTAGG